MKKNFADSNVSFLKGIICCLALFISSGSAAELKITGLSKEKSEEVYRDLEPRLEYILKREASSWRADDAAFFLKREMVRRGYTEAQVEWSIINPQTIGLQVSAGFQYLFGSIKSVDASPLKKGELREYFLQPLVNTERVSAKKAPYIEDYVDKGRNNVQNYLKSIGYWNTEVTVISEKKRDSEKKIDLLLEIQEGNLLKMSAPELNGASEENTARIKRRIARQIGRKASTKNINAINRSIEEFYADNGYQFATISLETEKNETNKLLIFTINEGAQYTVNEVTVTGTEKTLPKRIRRYYRKTKDKRYDQGEIDRITEKLISTGAFQSVRVNPIPVGGDSDLINLQIDVEETKAKSLRTYAGFGNFEGFIFGAGYSDNNFDGDLRRLYIGGEFSGIGLLGEVGVKEPRLFNSPLDASARLYLIDRSFDGFDVRKAGFEAALNWVPNKVASTRFYANTVFARSTTDSLNSQELGPDEYLATSFGVEQIFDFRNNPLVPTNGYHNRFLFETTFLTGSADGTLFRTEFENSYRYRIDRNHIIRARHLVSILKSEDPLETPIDLRLFSGGVNSQRAYNERELGPQSLNGDPLGGEAYWVGSLELIRPLSSIIDAVAFLDAGQLFSLREDFTFSDPSYAAGLGLRINLPIGPIRLEYGRNLNQEAGEPSGSFHFSIGASF